MASPKPIRFEEWVGHEERLKSNPPRLLPGDGEVLPNGEFVPAAEKPTRTIKQYSLRQLVPALEEDGVRDFTNDILREIGQEMTRREEPEQEDVPPPGQHRSFNFNLLKDGVMDSLQDALDMLQKVERELRREGKSASVEVLGLSDRVEEMRWFLDRMRETLSKI